MQVEHSGGVKAMTDEQIERGIELIKQMLAEREAGASAKVIEGEAEAVPSLPGPDVFADRPVKAAADNGVKGVETEEAPTNAGIGTLKGPLCLAAWSPDHRTPRQPPSPTNNRSFSFLLS